MSKTALQLVREVGKRAGEYIGLITSSAGTTTTLISVALNGYLPNNVTQLQAWVYATSTCVDVANRGETRRAHSWVASTSTLSMTSGYAWPAAPGSTSVGSGSYDLHTWVPHDRLLEAINAAIGELGLYCCRPVIDATLTTVDQRWQYSLPAGVNWGEVERVYLQVATDTALVGFPYQSADSLGWHIERTTSSTGVPAYTLQFRTLPPPGRTIKFYGDATYTDLSADTDILPIGGVYERPALEFIYDYAMACAHDWRANKIPSGDVERPRLQAKERFDRAVKRIVQDAPARKVAPRIMVPGSRGDYPSPGSFTTNPEDYAGIFRQLH